MSGQLGDYRSERISGVGYLGSDPVTVGLYVSAGPTVEGASPAETARCHVQVSES